MHPTTYCHLSKLPQHQFSRASVSSLAFFNLLSIKQGWSYMQALHKTLTIWFESCDGACTAAKSLLKRKHDCYLLELTVLTHCSRFMPLCLSGQAPSLVWLDYRLGSKGILNPHYHSFIASRHLADFACHLSPTPYQALAAAAAGVAWPPSTAAAAGVAWPPSTAAAAAS